MRLGILADIHGNLPALEEALLVGGARGVEQWICLGDIVDGGRWDGECVALIRRRNIPTVQGNHDVHHPDQLDDELEAFLAELPEDLVEHGIFCTHISPRTKRKRKVADRYEAWNVFDETSHGQMLVGHSHLSVAWRFNQRCLPGECGETILDFNQVYHLDPDSRHIISVGSLGYSRDLSPAPRFGVMNLDERTLSIIPVSAEPVIVR